MLAEWHVLGQMSFIELIKLLQNLMKLVPYHIMGWQKFTVNWFQISDIWVNDYMTKQYWNLKIYLKLSFISYLIDLFTPNFQYKKWYFLNSDSRTGCQFKSATFLSEKFYWLSKAMSAAWLSNKLYGKFHLTF